MEEIVVYYDFEPAIGINATCTDWDVRNLFFKTFGELRAFCEVEYGIDYRLVEITSDNYDELRLQGIFNV